MLHIFHNKLNGELLRIRYCRNQIAGRIKRGDPERNIFQTILAVEREVHIALCVGELFKHPAQLFTIDQPVSFHMHQMMILAYST